MLGSLVPLCGATSAATLVRANGPRTAAGSPQLITRYLRRAVTVMERVGFSPAALRADLAGARSAAGYLYAAAEPINHAAGAIGGKGARHARVESGW
jgi:hypothetical protein